jgi:hypothetical protein
MTQSVSGFGRRGMLALCLLAAHCTGTETTNPLRAFGAGECKRGHETELSLAPANALSMRDPYAGLDCLVYEVRDETLHVDLRNINDGCHVEHEGNVRMVGEDSLQLALTNAKCEAAKCGSCIYDAQYEVDLAPFAGQDSIELSLVLDDAESCRSPSSQTQVYWKLDVPLRASSQGAVCKYARYFEPPQGCGTLNMPCASADGACGFLGRGTGTMCDDGMLCRAPDENSISVCMQPCATDADCPEPDVLHCVEGACRL